MVKDVTFSILTDVQITEKLPQGPEEQPQAAPVGNNDKGKVRGRAAAQPAPREPVRKLHQTRIASYANQVNLKFDEAALSVQEGITKSISNIF